MTFIRTDGVRTIADIKDRCFVDEITGCWHWRGARSGGKTPDVRTPSLWLPALQRRTTLGIAICVLLTGEEPKPGVRWHCICETKGCANPDHRKAGNKSTQMLAAKLKRSPAQCARIAKGKRAVSELSDEAAAEIRLSEEPLRVLAARHSISISHTSNIKNGKQRRELGARGASVFNLGAQR